jgi:hypothetical protein
MPRRSVRLRLTALYGGLFLASGAALLAVTYGLVAGQRGAVSFRVAGTVKGAVKLVPGRVQIVLPAAAKALTKSLPASVRQGLGFAVPRPPLGFPLPGNVTFAGFQATLPTSGELHRLLIESAIALALMAVVSIGLGWLVAGRALRPLRTMTATARHISAVNLNERLAVRGPDDELKDLGDTIDGLLARLETSFEAQRRFVANASHELRTPLAMMRTSLDVAKGKPGPLPPAVESLAGKLEEGLDRADRLLEGLLLLARAQQGALGETTTVSLPGLVSEALGADQAEITKRALVVDNASSELDVVGNATLLSSMVSNVVGNAVRHNVPGGRINISYGLSASRARLVVDNEGPLIDEHQLEQLGEPFRRLGAERTANGDGAGLGLSIVKAIAQAHGGSLKLFARPGGGLRVVVELPTAAVPV